MSSVTFVYKKLYIYSHTVILSTPGRTLTKLEKPAAQAAKEALGEQAVAFVNRELCGHPGAQHK